MLYVYALTLLELLCEHRGSYREQAVKALVSSEPFVVGPFRLGLSASKSPSSGARR